MDKLKKDDKDFKRELDPAAYAVLREKATEPAFTGKFNAYKKEGMYYCGACGAELFKSSDKFDSGSGWPSFAKPVSEEVILDEKDKSFGMDRTEVICNNCGSHLGHVFDDGPTQLNGKPATGKRFCINSKALKFKGEGGEMEIG